jgi:hypothetical protein
MLLTVETKLCSNDGQILSHKKQKANSLTGNYLLQYYSIRDGPNATIKDTSGVNQTYTTSSIQDFANDSTSLWGIVVGTGSRANSITDFQLQSQIPAGSGLGQMLHSLSFKRPPAFVNNTVSFPMWRTFINMSGGTIVVNECGIYSRYVSGSAKYLMTERTVISPIVVNDGHSLVMLYTIGVSV